MHWPTSRQWHPAPRVAKVQASIDEEEWHMIGIDEQIELGTDWKDYKYTFTATDVRPNKNRRGIVMGMDKGKVYVRDRKLTTK